MLCGAADGTRTVAENGREFSGCHMAEIRDDLAFHAFFVGAGEDNAGIGVGGMEGQRHRKSGMNTDSADGNLVSQRCLTGFHTFSATLPGFGPQNAAPPELPSKPLFRQRANWRPKRKPLLC
jgi:hypothetical protein